MCQIQVCFSLCLDDRGMNKQRPIQSGSLISFPALSLAMSNKTRSGFVSGIGKAADLEEDRVGKDMVDMPRTRITQTPKFW